MANRFYTPIEAQSDNAGLITGLANLRLEARDQRYRREDQIAKGLMSPIKEERKFWAKEAVKSGMLPEGYGEATEINSPLRNVKKVADETPKLTEMKKNNWTADTGESNWDKNRKAAGLEYGKNGYLKKVGEKDGSGGKYSGDRGWSSSPYNKG